MKTHRNTHSCTDVPFLQLPVWTRYFTACCSSLRSHRRVKPPFPSHSDCRRKTQQQHQLIVKLSTNTQIYLENVFLWLWAKFSFLFVLSDFLLPSPWHVADDWNTSSWLRPGNTNTRGSSSAVNMNRVQLKMSDFMCDFPLWSFLWPQFVLCVPFCVCEGSQRKETWRFFCSPSRVRWEPTTRRFTRPEKENSSLTSTRWRHPSVMSSFTVTSPPDVSLI